jgi:hypothetical protein
MCQNRNFVLFLYVARLFLNQFGSMRSFMFLINLSLSCYRFVLVLTTSTLLGGQNGPTSTILTFYFQSDFDIVVFRFLMIFPCLFQT